MDQLERFGFIPNGGRIYYLNRSQPPLFVRMLDKYVKATNNTRILERALPLAELEHRTAAHPRPDASLRFIALEDNITLLGQSGRIEYTIQ